MDGEFLDRLASIERKHTTSAALTSAVQQQDQDQQQQGFIAAAVSMLADPQPMQGAHLAQQLAAEALPPPPATLLQAPRSSEGRKSECLLGLARLH
jgi:hypothetical protein